MKLDTDEKKEALKDYNIAALCEHMKWTEQQYRKQSKKFIGDITMLIGVRSASNSKPEGIPLN